MKSNQEESIARKTQTDRPAESGLAKAEAIRERAYQIFRERSATGHRGDAVMDWMQAEHELCDVRNHREIEGNTQATPSQEKSPTK
jgi:Protein of unknown function (DUF2934)